MRIYGRVLDLKPRASLEGEGEGEIKDEQDEVFVRRRSPLSPYPICYVMSNVLNRNISSLSRPILRDPLRPSEPRGEEGGENHLFLLPSCQPRGFSLWAMCQVQGCRELLPPPHFSLAYMLVAVFEWIFFAQCFPRCNSISSGQKKLFAIF